MNIKITSRKFKSKESLKELINTEVKLLEKFHDGIQDVHELGSGLLIGQVDRRGSERRSRTSSDDRGDLVLVRGSGFERIIMDFGRNIELGEVDAAGSASVSSSRHRSRPRQSPRPMRAAREPRLWNRK